jgi:hypothetical protein
METQPSPVVAGFLARLLAADPTTRAEVVPTCKAGVAAAVDSLKRYDVMSACLDVTGAKRIDDALPWAGAEGVAFYKKELGERRAQAAARERYEAERAPTSDVTPRTARSSSGASASGGWQISSRTRSPGR